jgi:hypothetical protein
VKKDETRKSNHGEIWNYIDNGKAKRTKRDTAKYGGTVFEGDKKFFKQNEWHNRTIETVL